LKVISGAVRVEREQLQLLRGHAMSHSQLIWLSSAIALLATGMLTLTAVFGNLLTLNQTQKLQLTGGQAFKYHRLISILGVVLILLHPIPLVLAQSTTGVSFAAIFVPFLADKKVTIIAVGVFALYILLVVLVSSLYMRYLKRKLWRVLHYGSYLFFGLSFWHGLSISDSFAPNAEVSLLEPKKIILEIEIALLLLVAAWRVMLYQNQQKSKQ
jgi:predicted ferric reductase